MRCPSCGTENAPDSRFCGGCGARVAAGGVESRVAPTAKVSDDAPFAPPSIPPGGYAAPASRPPQMAPARMPTPAPVVANAYGGPSSIPPSGPRPAPAAPPQVAMSSPSLSIPVRRQGGVGLIVAVLLLDLGLASAGAVLLGKGLTKPKLEPKPEPKTQTRTDPPPASTAPAPPPAPAAVAAGSGSAAPAAGSGSADPPAEPPHDKLHLPALAPPDPQPDPKHHEKKIGGKVKGGKLGGSLEGPLDPYDAPKSLAAEIDLAAARSKGSFEQCHKTAGTVHGEIHIAFQITPEGRIQHATAVDNTTGNSQLGTCLATALSSWAFATHPAQTTDFVRPFSYP